MLLVIFQVISSTLKPQGDELDLLYEIMDEGSVEDVELQDDSDKADIAVDGWNRILIEPEGKNILGGSIRDGCENPAYHTTTI